MIILKKNIFFNVLLVTVFSWNTSHMLYAGKQKKTGNQKRLSSSEQNCNLKKSFSTLDTPRSKLISTDGLDQKKILKDDAARNRRTPDRFTPPVSEATKKRANALKERKRNDQKRKEKKLAEKLFAMSRRNKVIGEQ